MNQQERLFQAIGEADPYLIARSEKQRRSRRPAYCFAAAACLALVLAAGSVLSHQRTGPVTAPPHGEAPPVGDAAETPPHDAGGPDEGELSLPAHGGDIGGLRLLSYAPQDREAAVDFLIYVNEEQFDICEEDGLYSIRNKERLPEGFPELGLDILHLPGTSCGAASSEAEEALEGRYTEFRFEEMAAALPGSLYLRASAGTDWDSEQAELWFVDDGQGGAFVLAARYFLEAEEGMGQCFRDMVSSFRPVSLDETVPDWMRELREAADRLFPALFTNDLSGVSDLLAGDAEADAYGEDVWADITVASVDYMPDSDREPSQATVSVKHRLHRVEGDSFRYLTMEMIRRDGRWLLTWSGIEK